jgi:hypothetical protein
MLLAVIGFDTARAANSSGLKAGTAKADITPPVGQPMGGFLGRLKKNDGACEGIHDRLFARVVVLDDGDTSVAIVAVDLLFFSSQRVVNQAKDKWNVDHVILSSTHTHAGPIPKTGGMVQWSNLNVNPAEVLDFEAFAEDPWYAATEDKIIAAIGQAMKNPFPARIGAGKGTLESTYLAHNRRLVGPDGKVTMRWANPKRLPTEPVDHTVRVLRIDDDSGQPRAVLVHFACHPVTLGSRNLLISADFPVATVTHVESQLGDGCMAMFLQGAAGDIDPYDMGLDGEYGHQIVRNTGVSLGTEALKIAKGITTTASDVRAKESLLSFGQRHKPDEKLDVGMTTIKIGADIALTSIPGEPFVEHQLVLAKNSPMEHTFLLGLAYNGSGIPFTIYLPTIQAAKEGGYGADSGTFLEVGAGERLVNEAIASMQELAGAFSKHPKDVHRRKELEERRVRESNPADQ